MSEEYSIGIDLGTTYSCLAYIDDNNEPVVERNYEHEDTTPSVILFNDVGEKLVGSSAKDMFLMYSSDRFVLDIKRKMGTDYSVDIDGIRYTPPTLSGLILRKLLKDFEENHGLDEGSVKSAVITVPAYFGQEEREATVNAGRIAGLEEVTLLNEPTAAAICFGFGNNQGGPKKVLVYDLGGGTFDVTVLQIDGKSFTAIATDGQRLMGGKDWDAALKQIIIGKIAEMSGLSEDEIEADSDIMEALVLDSEDLKKRLSTSESTRGTMTIGGRKVTYTVTREEFEDATRHLIDSTADTVEEVLNSKNLTVGDIDAFLLVGGSSRMPQVKSVISTRFPGANIKIYDPDQSIAKGAAVYCKSRDVLSDAKAEIKQQMDAQQTAPADETEMASRVDEVAMSTDDAIVVHNVLSKSLGVKAGDGNGNEYISNIVFRDVTLPLVENRTYYPYVDGQLSVEVEIFENSARNNEDGMRVELADATLVGSFPMKLPEDVTKNTPINIRFTVNDDGMVFAYVECKDQHAEYNLKTKTSMTDEEIRKYRGIVEHGLI
ncbi:MAG: Hsp70 family protein [Candidatus Methanomethylophilus sp.]|jgi:molecular chaperone DnaK|nr:Hsp70 family protein [Methanomethylophilus sp.]